MQFVQSTFDSAISKWRCILAIVSLCAGHTLSINSDNLPNEWLYKFIFLLNNSHSSVLCWIKSLQRLLETKTQCYATT